jgi:TolB protein
VATIAIVVLLIASMVFLAFVSGRGFVVPVQPGPDQPAATLRVAQASASPTAAGRGRLAVVDAAGRLVVAADTGAVSAPLGDPRVAYSFPAWSPDGSRIAVIGDDHGTGVVHVFTVRPDGSGPLSPAAVYESPDRPPFYLSWSPDGARVSFLAREPGGGIALSVAPADASEPAAVVREGAPMYWTWTGADRLVLHSGTAGDAYVGEVGLDGAATEPSVPGTGGVRAPAVSADRAFVGYVERDAGSNAQVIAEARHGSGRNAVDVHGDAAIEFSPTSSDLAFIAPDAPGPALAIPAGPLRVLSAPTGDVRVLLAETVVAFFWAPDGRTIAALTVARPTDDKVARAADRPGAVALARARITAAAPGVEVRLVFVDPSSGTTRGARAVRVSELFVGQVLPFFDQYALSHRFWSPDSRAIALPIAADDGSVSIVAIPTDGGPTTRIAGGVAASWSP